MLFGIDPNELETHICTNTCMLVFIVALFIIVLNQKQPGYPLVGDLTKYTVVHICSENNSTKKNELSRYKYMEES